MNLLERFVDIQANVQDVEDIFYLNDYLHDVYGVKKEPVMDFVFTLNETDGVIVGHEKCSKLDYVVRCTKGDKYDAYTGVAIILFEALTGYSYGKLNETISKFAPRTKDCDPTMNFIKLYVKQRFNMDEKSVKELLEIAEKVEHKKKKKDKEIIKTLYKVELVIS